MIIGVLFISDPLIQGMKNVLHAIKLGLNVSMFRTLSLVMGS